MAVQPLALPRPNHVTICTRTIRRTMTTLMTPPMGTTSYSCISSKTCPKRRNTLSTITFHRTTMIRFLGISRRTLILIQVSRSEATKTIRTRTPTRKREMQWAMGMRLSNLMTSLIKAISSRWIPLSMTKRRGRNNSTKSWKNLSGNFSTEQTRLLPTRRSWFLEETKAQKSGRMTRLTLKTVMSKTTTMWAIIACLQAKTRTMLMM